MLQYKCAILVNEWNVATDCAILIIIQFYDSYIICLITVSNTMLLYFLHFLKMIAGTYAKKAIVGISMHGKVCTALQLIIASIMHVASVQSIK